MPKKSLKSQLRPPGGATAALYFLEGEYCFQSADESGLMEKFISPASVRAAFAKESLDSGWLPPGVNRYGSGAKGDWMVRWHAPAVYAVRLADLKRPLLVPMPSLVWIGQRHNYFIFAAKEGAFTPNATLYYAPLANVNSSGLICFGRNPHPDVAQGGFDAAWWTFWEAPFNNDHSTGKSRVAPNGINQYLKKLSAEKASAYPLEDLVSMNRTLNQVIETLTRRGNE
ncbi:MAG TPA: hypothetical protein PKC13_30815 [Blastocatellia bacterium]|nr:hypothetical protein [Blastocatellia bacterium]